ncbi:hypothetical protein MKX03_029285 [Papaver bracteatum]|nr:hypothetical protein MKX03_009740 [Papaver bracteatum]KAI3863309.1 hypothetical protein MKX03_029285 [Papaver bracteatum]
MVVWACLARYQVKKGIGICLIVRGVRLKLFLLELYASRPIASFPVGVADRMHWVDERNCLFLSKLIFPVVNSKSCISLVDFRDKSIVWSMPLNNTSNLRRQYVADAVPAEEGNSIWVVSNYEELGYADLRRNSGSIEWNFDRELRMKTSYPKLAIHGSQLFCSIDDKVSVYCRGLDRWVMTSCLPRTPGGSIRDFSIGGDRLFTLHAEGNVIDVWETPPVPNYLSKRTWLLFPLLLSIDFETLSYVKGWF